MSVIRKSSWRIPFIYVLSWSKRRLSKFELAESGALHSAAVAYMSSSSDEGDNDDNDDDSSSEEE
jgi:hypothetical protein